MINCANFSQIIQDNGVHFFSGVPDSLLKDICGYMSDNYLDNHIIAANEGNAVGIAAGYHLATGNVPLVYLQNSGLGNTVNPLTSLMSEDVYSMPMVLLIGWRGQPGVKDEPQHVMQGRISEDMLTTLDIPYEVISAEMANLEDTIASIVATAKKRSCPVALLVSKGSFEPYKYTKSQDVSALSRESALTIMASQVPASNALIVSTTGKLSRELYEFRKREKSAVVDFYNVGSMGHLSQIALGLAKYSPNKKVFCFDGDGAALMHMGGLAVAASQKLKNYFYIMFNNEAHDSVGGQSTVAANIDFGMVAQGLGFSQVLQASNELELQKIASEILDIEGPVFLEVMIKKGARKELGRPTETPVENKVAFMEYAQK